MTNAQELHDTRGAGRRSAQATGNGLVFPHSLKSKLLWQAEMLKGPSADEALTEVQRRNGWQREALLAAAEVVARLRPPSPTGREPEPLSTLYSGREHGASGEAPEPTLMALIDIGWMAWDAGLETEALRILGGVGGAADGALGRAQFQASAFMRSERDAEAAAVLEHAVARWDDPRGAVSSSLVMLWLSLGNSRWQALARRVALHASDARAREICADALNSHGRCSIGHLN